MDKNLSKISGIVSMAGMLAIGLGAALGLLKIANPLAFLTTGTLGTIVGFGFLLELSKKLKK